MPEAQTVQVSFRLPSKLVRRMRAITMTPGWPPPPSQTEIVSKGIEMVLQELEPLKQQSRRRGKEPVKAD